jgi:hypothetical protein
MSTTILIGTCDQSGRRQRAANPAAGDRAAAPGGVAGTVGHCSSESNRRLEPLVVEELFAHHLDERLGVLRARGPINPWKPFPQMRPIGVCDAKELVGVTYLEELQSHVVIESNRKHGVGLTFARQPRRLATPRAAGFKRLLAGCCRDARQRRNEVALSFDARPDSNASTEMSSSMSGQ